MNATLYPWKTMPLLLLGSLLLAGFAAADPVGVKVCTDTLLEGPFDPDDCTEAGEPTQQTPFCETERGIFLAKATYEYRIVLGVVDPIEDGTCIPLYLPPIGDP